MVEDAALFHPCIMISWFDKKSDHVSNLEGHLKIERLDAVSTLWPQASDVDFCSNRSSSHKDRTVSLARLAGSPHSQGRSREEFVCNRII